MKKILFIGLALVATVFGACDKNAHDGERGLAVTLNVLSRDAVKNVQLFIFDQAGTLVKSFEYASTAELASTLIPLPAADYTVLAATNLKGAFNYTTVAGSTRIEALEALLAQASASPAHANYGRQAVQVTDSDICHATIVMNRALSEFQLIITQAPAKVLRAEAEVLNTAVGFYPANGQPSAAYQPTSLGTAILSGDKLTFDTMRLLPTVPMENSTTGDDGVLRVTFYYADGTSLVCMATTPAMLAGHTHRLEVMYNTFRADMTVTITDIDGWTTDAVTGTAEYTIIDNPKLTAILGAAPYNVPVASDGYIHPNLPATKAALDKITQLNVGSKGLTSLAGIEYLPNLTLLSCSGNQLTTLDVTKNTALQTLYCGTNSLTTLDVTKNTALQTLNCGHNQLTTLDVTKNTALQTLGCFENQLTTLDVTKNTALQTLFCGTNSLTTLDVTKNTALKHLLCYLNPLTTLDVTKNTALQYLDCSRNALTVLDVTKNTALQYLACLGNSLTTLDLTKNTALQTLQCSTNSLTTLDLTTNTALQELACFSNQLTALDVTTNTALQTLYCNNNSLTALDVTTNTALQKLQCSTNSLTVLNVTKHPALQELDCSSNHLTALDITKNPALQTLWCNSQTTAGGGVQNLVLSWTQAQSTQSGLLQGTTGVTTQIVP